jgi:hypothetical protein
VKPVAIVKDNHNFWQEVWREAEPIVAHAMVVLLLETSLLLIGLLAWLLEHLFPKQETYFTWMRKWIFGQRWHYFLCLGFTRSFEWAFGSLGDCLMSGLHRHK